MSTHDGLEALSQPAGDGAPELVVDLSNVCRNGSIGRPSEIASWDRLLVALDAWSRWELGFERPVVRLIADDTLRKLLCPDDRRALKNAERDGYAQVLEYADPVILDLAETYECAVLSNDQFVGHRRERPWLEDNADRFVQIHGDDGAIELRLVQLSPRSAYSMSRAEESDEMKARHINLAKDQGRDMLESVYRCDDKSCPRCAFSPEGSTIPPVKAADGSAICPGCKAPLTRVGSRVDTAVMKLTSVHGQDSVRLPLARGSAVAIGRTSPDLSLKNLLPAADLPRISREHVVVSFDGRLVIVEERGSTNGTVIERWQPADKQRGDPARMATGQVETLRARDRAILGGVLVLERSGRRFPFDLGTPDLPSQQATPPRTMLQTGGQD